VFTHRLDKAEKVGAIEARLQDEKVQTVMLGMVQGEVTDLVEKQQEDGQTLRHNREEDLENNA